MQRLIARFTPSATGKSLLTTLSYEAGAFQEGELLALLHTRPRNHDVTSVTVTPNHYRGGWDVHDVSTGEVRGHVLPLPIAFPHGKENQ